MMGLTLKRTVYFFGGSFQQVAVPLLCRRQEKNHLFWSSLMIFCLAQAGVQQSCIQLPCAGPRWPRQVAVASSTLIKEAPNLDESSWNSWIALDGNFQVR